MRGQQINVGSEISLATHPVTTQTSFSFHPLAKLGTSACLPLPWGCDDDIAEITLNWRKVDL